MSVENEKAVRKALERLKTHLDSGDLPRCRSEFDRLSGAVDKLVQQPYPRITLSARAWSVALLQQAREDLSAAELIDANQGPTSVLAMLLQMVFEKLAKAAIARTDPQCFEAIRVSHAASSRFVQILKHNRDFTDLCYDWKRVLPQVQRLERSHPALQHGGPHLEYPWESMPGPRMATPSEVPIVAELDDPTCRTRVELLRFAQELVGRFDVHFP